MLWRLLWLVLGVVMVAEAAALIALDFVPVFAWLLGWAGLSLAGFALWWRRS